MLAGLGAAVGLRALIAGTATAASAPAGLAFALALGTLAAASGTRPTFRDVGCRHSRSAYAAISIRSLPGTTRRVLLPGLALAAVLCLPAALNRLTADTGGHRPGGSYLTWAAVVAAVAVAEEAFLRGALYDASLARYGPATATVISALAFAGLHVPFYGWHTAVLNTAVGVCLGVLREITGRWEAPAVAHTAADLAAWWLR
ncbi:hypothetical protein KRMM14A1259_32470 [Krasilnikovia sp. MM14-A1259]